eukprot:TRINITY_DN6081_c0_g1_i1.p1 TRINITY_DN6081_c0_g1~~TRINITY_DN6081_c0_g1_i1.p1  ORF type:complete len:219 (-),score=68.14 TRINITY_DN6081_c0_g1_i1:271-927(-)
MMEISIVFLVYGQIKRFLTGGKKEELSLPQLCASGAAAGFFASLVLCPVELIKCRLQVQQNELPRFKGPIDCLVQTLKTEGIRGLYRGYLGTMIREVPGNAIWFGVYEAVCRLQAPLNGTKDDLTLPQLMVSGAFAGMFYWLIPFPADVIKSNMQTSLSSGGQSTFFSTCQKIYRTQGIKGFYRGCGITVSRAAPSNAVIFGSYELCRKIMDHFEEKL